MAIVDTIIEGNVWQSAVTVTDAPVDGNPVDPGTLSLVYILNSDPTTKETLTYVSATVPAIGVVARTAEGDYVGRVSLIGISGTIERYWESTGVGQAVSSTDTIIVPAKSF